MTFNLKWHEISNDMKSQMTWNLTRYEISKDMKSQMIWNLKWHEMSKGTKYQISWNVKCHEMSNVMKCWSWCWIYDPKQKRQALHTSERTIVPRTVIFSSEGALIAITPYDYPAHPLFEHTPVLDNNLNIMLWWLWWLWLQ